MITARESRSEIPVAHTWNLAPVFETIDDWQQAAEEIPGLLETLESFRGTLGDNADRLLEALQTLERVHRRVDRVRVYASLLHDEDLANDRAKALYDRAIQLTTDLQRVGAFYRPEILALSSETIDTFIQERPELAEYRHYLENLLRAKPHVLSPPEEQLLAGMGEIAYAPSTIYEMLSNTDMEFGTVHDSGRDEEVPLSLGRYEYFIHHKDRRMRRDAFTNIFSEFEAHRNTCAAAFSAHVKKNIYFARARNFDSAVEAALHPSNIPVEVYTNLIQSVHAHLPLLHRYMALRQRVLEVDELHMYDLHVPLFEREDAGFEYERAVEEVLDAVAPLGDAYVTAAREGFASRWVDVYESPNKRSGAYSGGSYDTAPYILLNYQPTLNSVYTIAHELGHSMHSLLTWRRQPYVYADYSIFVAEVASFLNEALLTQHLLESSGPAVRRAIINAELDSFRTTLYRQTQFAEFELRTHQLAERGEALTPDRLSTLYYDLNQHYYGPNIVHDPLIAIEWAYVPHFYYDFYVFQYATGIAAATALAQQILDEGEPAAERYRRFLSSGSSDYSIELLADAGVDMRTPEPIERALALFEQRLDEFEGLLDA